MFEKENQWFVEEVGPVWKILLQTLTSTGVHELMHNYGKCIRGMENELENLRCMNLLLS